MFLRQTRTKGTGAMPQPRNWFKLNSLIEKASKFDQSENKCPNPDIRS